MEIWIPSLGRSHVQRTWESLPPVFREQTRLIVHESESAAYSKFPRVALPISGVGNIRQWVIEHSRDKVLMLDDDLTFFTRRSDDKTKFQPATSEEVVEVFDLMRILMDQFYHGGLASREGGHIDTSEYVWNTRVLRVLYYRADILRKFGVRFDRVPVMEDFDVALQMLRLGFPSLMVNTMVHNQGSSNAPGGCSTYRTLERQSEAAHALAKLHPEFVTVVTKQTKTAWGGQERTDVRVQWKRAYDSSPNLHLLDRGAGASSQG